ncbi:MAG TPA: hypothetical protein VKI19_02185 [Acidimicrobiales bacterium]|nr:hypothetical protein [Acidimicrobiales bacterium]
MTIWCRITAVTADDRVAAVWQLEGAGAPDMAAVEAVAQQALGARRAGNRLVLEDVAPGLDELLRLAGLAERVGGPVQVERKAESGEQPLGVEEVEEERHLGDLPA